LASQTAGAREGWEEWTRPPPASPPWASSLSPWCSSWSGWGSSSRSSRGLITQFKGGSIAEGSDSYGWLVGTFAAMQFISSPILGSLSDRYGRRKVILVALTGSAIDYVVLGLAPNMAWLFVARVISGATAGSLAACNAYIADVTPPERRAQAYGLVGGRFRHRLCDRAGIRGLPWPAQPQAALFCRGGLRRDQRDLRRLLSSRVAARLRTGGRFRGSAPTRWARSLR
jgi:hypothetical protein